MKGVTMAVMCATSPLGKLLFDDGPNQSFGSFPWDGRARRVMRLMTSADTSVATMDSVDFQNVPPSRESLPSQSAPPMTVIAERYWTAFWFDLDQMPLSSKASSWSMPAWPAPLDTVRTA